jgi:hypothetical protein
MKKLSALASLSVGLMLLATQAEAEHQNLSTVVHAQRDYVRLVEVCALGFWCDTGILNSNEPAAARPLVAPKAKLTHGIDRTLFRPEIANHPDLVVKMTHMVFGEVGRNAPLPVKVIQLETALHGSNLSDVGYGPMTGNASADVAAHQFAKGDLGYQLQAGDAYFREGPFINDFPEASPSALSRLGLDGNDATSFGSIAAPAPGPSHAELRERGIPTWCRSLRRPNVSVCGSVRRNDSGSAVSVRRANRM